MEGFVSHEFWEDKSEESENDDGWKEEKDRMTDNLPQSKQWDNEFPKFVLEWLNSD